MPSSLAPILVLVAVLLLAGIYQSRVVKTTDYQCDQCDDLFSLSIWQSVFAPHSMGKKYVRCPSCEEMTWAEPTPKSGAS
jgi:ssDNA-binding Zn-finger/Zn-ribbon topoisomerase 1